MQNNVTVRNLQNLKITGFKISFKTLWCLEKMGYFQEFVFLPVFKKNQILLCSWLECTAELTSETFDLLIKNVIYRISKIDVVVKLMTS